MGYIPWCSGFVRLSASGAVFPNDLGKPVLISGASVLSGGTAAIPYVLNGSTSTSPLCFRLQGAANIAVQETIGQLPVMMPTGAYVSFDANTTEVTIFAVLQSVTS